MKLHCLTLFLALAIFSTSASAQQPGYKISGKVFEKESLQPLPGATVAIYRDKKLIGGTQTNASGLFEIHALKPDTYILQVSYIGFNTKTQRVVLTNEDRHIGMVLIEKSEKSLSEVKIEGTQIRVEQKGDTTSINASAYKVNPDATAEDLVKKMPGITIENGTVKAQGEDVKKILLDGKEFFGDDAQMALKNLPAEVIDKVQVFNRLGDQAQFTGFNDGNTDKTMNITTKPGRNNGTFGKVYFGYGTNDRYQAGGNLNIFKGDRRITLLGISNNINQQNFSMQDLFGGTGGNMRMLGMGGGGMGRMGMGGGGMGDMSNFFVGQQSGIATTNSVGINYSDKWGKKTQVTGSYFFNGSDTRTAKTITRNYLINPELEQQYIENTESKNLNYNNRFNLRLEHNFDSTNSLLFTPKISFQNSDNSSSQIASNNQRDTLLNSTSTDKETKNTGFTLNSNLLYRHKFAKPGRTISLNVGTDISRKNSGIDQNSLNIYKNQGNSETIDFKQHTRMVTDNTGYNANLTYTEQITKTSQLQFSYNPTYSVNTSDKRTNVYNKATGEYDSLNTYLSNTFSNTVNTQRTNVSINVNKEKYTFTAGLTHQYLELASNQTYPAENSFRKPFNNLLPNANLQYKLANNKTLRMVYRTNTNTPNVNQLQNVVDNSNPLLLSTGNPNLKQEYSQTALIRYGANNWMNSQSFFVFAMATLTNNYIANSTYTATTDSITLDGISIARGAQLSKPVNLSGYLNSRSFLTYGIPIKALKSNLNLNAGVNYSKVPGLVNNKTNYANTFNLTGGFVLGSNISERIDFTISHNANINYVKNTLITGSNSNYFINTTGLKGNFMPVKSLALSTELSYTNYKGLGSGFNQDFLLWNAGIAYKFLKRMGELKLSVFDMLNQNNSINRTVTETYIEDARSNVLNRYFMLTFTYNIRKFGVAAPQQPTTK